MVGHTLLCPSLVGRDDELAALAQRRAASARGRGGLILIEGEAGIGKSRLVREFCETLTNGRAGVGSGTCREFGNAPYGPVLEALATAGSPVRPPARGSRAEELLELRSHFTLASERRNRVLVLEDLQWADEGSLAFLHYLLSYIGSMRLLVVATYRPDDMLGNAHAQYVTRLARDRGTFRLQLAPLSPMQARHAIRLALGTRTIAGAQIENIVRRAEGNPFFAEELLGHALEAGAPHALPSTIRAAVMERIAALDSHAIEIATRAAALGRRFEAEFLATTFAYPLAEVLKVLRALRDLGIIAQASAHPPVYQFRHELAREAIYGSLMAAEARPLHALVLRALEDRNQRNAHDLGYHAWGAGNQEKCALYNELAGDEAEEGHAHADAVHCYERALENETAPDPRVRILMKAALSASRDGMAERAAQLYDAAGSILKAYGTPQQIAEIYYAMGSQARQAGDNARAMAILDRAVRDLPETATRARAMLRITSALMHCDRGETEAANALIAEASAAADLPIYHNAVGYAALNAGDLNAFRAANAAYRSICDAAGADQILRARFNRAFGLCILGIDAEAIAEFDAILPELAQARLSSLEILSYANAAIVHARAGRLHLAREFVERGLAIPEPTTTGPIALASAGVSIGEALCDADVIRRCTRDGIVEAAFASGINSTLGRLAGPYARWIYNRGERSKAISLLSRAMRAIAHPLGATETMLAAAEIGDEAVREMAFGFIPTLGRLEGLEIYAATAAHLRAFREGAAGSPSMRRLHAIRAATHYRNLGWQLHEARCLELAGDRAGSSARFAALEARADLQRIAPLSSREREVAALVAGGAANKRIAGDLDVSQRTVEKYLTSIYGKLGLRNRSELAAFVGRDGKLGGSVPVERRHAGERTRKRGDQLGAALHVEHLKKL
jgi:DNA-binding CsgD family transcriptional regulator